MKELGMVLERFRKATGTNAVIWSQAVDGGPVLAEFGDAPSAAPRVLDLLSPGNAPAEVALGDEAMLAAAVPGPRRAWMTVGPVARDKLPEAGRHLDFLVPVVGHYFQSALEVEHAAYELAERYEEINLLYTTSEILGRTVSLEEAASRILAEICETVGARRAAILVHDRVTDTLQVVTALGFREEAPPINTTDPSSVSAKVFREQRAMILLEGEMPCDAESLYRKGAFLSVPILWTNPNPHGAIPLGVVNLSERRTNEPFSAGDEKLVTAIATQIGTAIQNARLVRSSLAQQRLQQEMELANDLQMRLLPNTALFAPEIEVAARVVPADSVGGDFYQLFRLGGGNIGVMIGDVSSHGYRAALVMALMMSASSIHAQTTSDPAEVLNAVLATLQEELESTEMFISVFYAVIDPRRGILRYANAGHPHAFVVGADGEVERLAAFDPPLGMSAQRPGAGERSWAPSRDLLLLFTDGISDARNRQDARLGEQPVIDVARDARAEPTSEVVERIFAVLEAHAGDMIRRDDLTLLVART